MFLGIPAKAHFSWGFRARMSYEARMPDLHPEIMTFDQIFRGGHQAPHAAASLIPPTSLEAARQNIPPAGNGSDGEWNVIECYGTGVWMFLETDGSVR
jgi:hypothetical protein